MPMVAVTLRSASQRLNESINKQLMSISDVRVSYLLISKNL